MAYDLTDLELFLQVVDRGSITQGAERAHLSLASASTRITAMEKALGAKLLERHRRGVVPSPTGWLLVAHARAIVGQLARMRTELARAADGLQSPLVVLANTSATQTLLPTGQHCRRWPTQLPTLWELSASSGHSWPLKHCSKSTWRTKLKCTPPGSGVASHLSNSGRSSLRIRI